MRGRVEIQQGERGETLRTKLISLAHTRGLGDIARFLARMNDDQIVRLVRATSEWKQILAKRGIGGDSQTIKNPSAADRLFLTAAALAGSSHDLKLLMARVSAVGDAISDRPSVIVPAPILSGSPAAMTPLLR